MKYVYITGRCDNQDVYESDNLDELIERADSDWKHMCDEDRRNTVSHYVLESANPDEDAADHFDGEVMYDIIHGGV